MMCAIMGCAAGPNDKVRHGLEIEVDKSVGKATNIRYTYGDELVDETRPVAIAIGSFTTYIARMHIPEEFHISWETSDGTKHDAKVPVRSRLSGSIENKDIVFVIMADHVEGYVGVWTPYGQKRERFY
ncbi:hypothetical protein THUN1379_08470 [Paludibacterium sp. THUN1379]|nr:hypothetical protein THUN1379_08470 [Paludibacterium sp. THUN1379]